MVGCAGFTTPGLFGPESTRKVYIPLRNKAVGQNIPKIARQRIFNASGIPIAEEALCRDKEVYSGTGQWTAKLMWDVKLVKWASFLVGALPLHINVLPGTFAILNLLENEMHLPAVKQSVVFEILETGITEFIPDIVEFAKNGYRLALDDFGTREANYDLLDKFLPHLVPEVKLDMRFVKSNPVFLVEKIRELKGRGYKVIVEGVEDGNLIRVLGADGYQGYGLHKPATDDLFIKYKTG